MRCPLGIFASRTRKKRGFTMVELAVAISVLGSLMVVGTPMFLQPQAAAVQNEAVAGLEAGHTLAKSIFIDNGDHYPTTDTLVFDLQSLDDQAYGFRPIGEGINSTGPVDLTMEVDSSGQILTICDATRTSDITLCGRWNESGKLNNQGTSASADDGNAQAAFAVGLGEYGQQDALAALPTASSAPTWDAGPTGTGTPVSPITDDPITAPAAPPVQPPQISFTETPTINDDSNTATFSWENTGGVSTDQTCTIDGYSWECADDTVELDNLTAGQHTFSVTATNASGDGSDQWVWTDTDNGDNGGNGLFVGLSGISLSGNMTIDSFDSGQGSYSQSKSANSAIVSNGAITISGSATVSGDLSSTASSISMSGSIDVTGSATAGTSITGASGVQGTVTANDPTTQIATPTVESCSPYSSGSGISGYSSYSAGNLTASGNKTVTFAAGTYCLDSITLSGNSTIKVSGPVVIYLDGSLSASGGSFINTTGLASDLQIMISSSAGATFSGSSSSYMAVCAPDAAVTLSGNSPVYGALFAKSIVVSGNASFHVDLGLPANFCKFPD